MNATTRIPAAARRAAGDLMERAGGHAAATLANRKAG